MARGIGVPTLDAMRGWLWPTAPACTTQAGASPTWRPWRPPTSSAWAAGGWGDSLGEVKAGRLSPACLCIRARRTAMWQRQRQAGRAGAGCTAGGNRGKAGPVRLTCSPVVTEVCQLRQRWGRSCLLREGSTSSVSMERETSTRLGHARQQWQDRAGQDRAVQSRQSEHAKQHGPWPWWPRRLHCNLSLTCGAWLLAVGRGAAQATGHACISRPCTCHRYKPATHFLRRHAHSPHQQPQPTARQWAEAKGAGCTHARHKN